MKWIDVPGYLKKWRRAVQHAAEQFNWTMAPRKISAVENNLRQKETIDMGLLDEKFQKQVVEQLILEPLKRKELIRLNPFLTDIGKHTKNHHLIAHNKTAVLQAFNQATYQKVLLDIYEKVTMTPVTQKINKDYLISRFFNIEHLSLLKWAAYED